MTNVRIQAIAGVSAGVENVVAVVYPSVASTGIGRLLGRLNDSIPLKLNGIKLSHLLFQLPTSPIAAALYLLLKITGNRYVLTNRSLQVWKAMGNRLVSQATLSDIADVEVVPLAGQPFYNAAELVVLGKGDAVLLRLEGVPCAEVFRRTILEARDARMMNDAAFATIQARQPA